MLYIYIIIELFSYVGHGTSNLFCLKIMVQQTSIYKFLIHLLLFPSDKILKDCCWIIGLKIFKLLTHVKNLLYGKTVRVQIPYHWGASLLPTLMTVAMIQDHCLSLCWFNDKMWDCAISICIILMGHIVKYI